MPNLMQTLVGRRALVAFVAAAPLVAAACTVVEERQTAGEYLDDATITTRIKSAILQDPDVKVMQVSVETYNGNVQLSGFVDNATAKSRAAQIAQATEGVKSVRNDLQVR